MKDSGAAVSRLAPIASQPDEAGMTMDPGAVDPLVATVFHIREIPSWVEPFSNYLITGDLPQDEAEARQLQRCVLMTHKYRGSQQSSREVKPKFIDSTHGEPKNIYKP
jgi:hypothetical protein